MLIPSKFNGYVAGRRTCNTGMEPILLGAALGGGTSALRGDDPLKGALFGGLTGGIGSAVAPALGTLFSSQLPASAAAPIVEGGMGLNAAAAQAATNQGIAALPQSFMPLAESATALPINMGALELAGLPSQGGLAALQQGLDLGAFNAAMPEAFQAAIPPEVAASQVSAAPSAVSSAPQLASPEQALFTDPKLMASQAQQFSPSTASTAQTPAANQGIKEWWKSLPTEKKLLYGGAGGLGLMALMGGRNKVPGQAPYTGPLSRFRYNPDFYRPQTLAQGGGVSDIYVGEPTSAQPMARGGIADLGSYSDGGRLLKGPGDGMSDNIPATISNKRPARLADGEFVVPADVVSHLGNGSTDAGAKQLYSMMDKVRKARTGNPKQGKQIRPQKFMPA